MLGAGFIYFLHTVLEYSPGDKNIPRGKGKIIDSKVPAGMGYVIVPRRVAFRLLNDQLGPWNMGRVEREISPYKVGPC